MARLTARNVASVQQQLVGDLRYRDALLVEILIERQDTAAWTGNGGTQSGRENDLGSEQVLQQLSRPTAVDWLHALVCRHIMIDHDELGHGVVSSCGVGRNGCSFKILARLMRETLPAVVSSTSAAL
ncbi:MAG: hypothetical protein R2855_09995 [Thermomicrobiales bacterium]